MEERREDEIKARLGRVAGLEGLLAKFKAELGKKEPDREILDQLGTQLYDLATKDPLTGLYNFGYLGKSMFTEEARALREREPLSCAFLDIYKFKPYNDSYGHEQGNEVIKAVARIMQDGRRKSDICARYGGEELVILLPNTPLEGAYDVGERIMNKVAEADIPIVNPTAEGKRIKVSVGIATMDGESIKSALDMVTKADQAMYAAKNALKSGKTNRVYAYSTSRKEPIQIVRVRA